MSPLEAVTHLFASIQIADQQASYEEKESWINAITKLFPEHSEDRAEKFFAEAHDVLATKNPEKRSCLLYTSPSPRDGLLSRMPSSA